MIAALLALARAQDDPDAGDDPLEVIVYGELRVEQARQEVVEELEELGYDHEVADLGNYVVYRHEAPWKGEVVLYDDGYMVVRRQPMHAEGRRMPWAKRNTPLAWAGCLLWPWACIRINGQTVSERKWRSRETRTVAQVAPKVQQWGDRIADLATDRKVQALPDALEALWEEGVPLDGSERLATFAERRAAILAFWGSRTETAWGRQVQQTVVSFCRGVVQRSEHPFTAEEIARFNAGRDRPFELARPALAE